jgi:carboxyl-terminal processing protease
MYFGPCIKARTALFRVCAAGPRVFLVGVFAALAGSCGDGPEAETFTPFTVSAGCEDVDQVRWVDSSVREWYLYPESLPAFVGLDQFGSPDALLNALTEPARLAGRDRQFSVITKRTTDESFLGQGVFVGFGLTLVRSASNERLFVADVFESSPAAAAGIRRGDEIVSIGLSDSDLQPVSQLLSQFGELERLLGPSFPGITRTFILAPPDLQRRRAVISKAAFSFVSIPSARIVQRPGLTPIGYLNLRAFVASSEDQLRATFRSFKERAVEDVVIDVRYNGGGALDVAELILNLLGAARVPSDEMFRTRYHPIKNANSRVVRFRPSSDSIGARRVAVLTTGLTASASEVLINALSPYADVAIVGSRTLGKPVGNIALDMPGCDVRLRLVAFDVLNSVGTTGFFGGLPDALFTDTFCDVPDDLAVAQGSDSDPMFAAAAKWLSSGVCEHRAQSSVPPVSNTVAIAPQFPINVEYSDGLNGY